MKIDHVCSLGNGNMIIICEPQCKGISHEKFNSGYIYGLRLSYPEETIRFYAETSHIVAIKNILFHDNIIIENIEFIPISYRDIRNNQDIYSIVGMVTYYLLFKKIFSDLLEIGINKIFFLSYTPTILYVIKKLKQKPKFQEMKFTFVLHGDFENIADGYDKPVGLSIPIKILPNTSVGHQVSQMEFIDLFYKVPRYIRFKIMEVTKQLLGVFGMPWRFICPILFSTKKMLLWNHSSDFKYIANSPHIITNAGRYINVEKLNIYTVVLPTVFAQPIPQPHNEYVKFATFGYGDSLMLHNVAFLLSQKKVTKPYEIRIIGMDNRGTDGLENITCPGSGKVLDRAEMEKYAFDIDMFLILYDITRYRLGCSGTILESLSYMKPILHFNNDCVNYFSPPEKPVGICCENLDDFVCKLLDIIENYESYIPEFQIYRENIMKLREKYAIINSIPQLQESFTW